VKFWLVAASVLRRLMPASLRSRVRQFLFAWLRLQWVFPSGIDIRIANYGEWIVYNEVFVAGEYDRALALAFDRAAPSGRTPHVVDLGANVGFFTLRVLHEARQRGTSARVTAIEAHPALAARFRARVDPQRAPAEQVRLVQGLAGARSGTALFYEDTVQASGSTQVEGRRPGRRQGTAMRLSYVDLSAITDGEPFVDLIKCDIEGSEEQVIENYGDLFAKAGVAVFELHRDLCDVARCQEMLRGCGFTHAATLREGMNFTYLVWR